MSNCIRILIASIAFAGITCSHAIAEDQGISVSFRLQLQSEIGNSRSAHTFLPLAGSNTVVAWLTPLDSPRDIRGNPPISPHSYVLAQKNKQFIPHLLVVPTGSSVDFPNLDPFFHNVFSLFNGRRFDLGLYESGARRSVRFDHAGVSYIFCNIHPEMAAVIVSLSTPYYAIANADGSIVLPNVPPGNYELNLWSQNVSPEDQAAAKRRVQVSKTDLRLPTVVLQQTKPLSNDHLNKFGEPYKSQDLAPY